MAAGVGIFGWANEPKHFGAISF